MGHWLISRAITRIATECRQQLRLLLGTEAYIDDNAEVFFFQVTYCRLQLIANSKSARLACANALISLQSATSRWCLVLQLRYLHHWWDKHLVALHVQEEMNIRALV